MSAATVIRLRSRGESSGRSQMSPNRTSSVSDTSFGEKSPINCWARVGAPSSEFIRVSVLTSCFWDRAAVVLEVDVRRLGAATDPGVEPVDSCELGLAELEVEDVEVLGDALGAHRLRD